MSEKEKDGLLEVDLSTVPVNHLGQPMVSDEMKRDEMRYHLERVVDRAERLDNRNFERIIERPGRLDDDQTYPPTEKKKPFKNHVTCCCCSCWC
jgi:hypothetical protein